MQVFCSSVQTLAAPSQIGAGPTTLALVLFGLITGLIAQF